MRPAVAVIIPWSGQAPLLLEQQLACMMAQDLTEPMEIRIGANSATALDHSARLSGCGRADRPVLVIDASSKAGPSHARNAAAAGTTATTLLFCDADDEAEPSWARHLQQEIAAGATLVGGSVDYERLNPTPFNLSRSAALPIAFRFKPFSPSACLGVRADVFAQLGGFDEAFSSGEDVDLCWRAQYAGNAVSYAPRARMNYRLRQSAWMLWRQGVAYGGSDVRLYLRHRRHGMRRRPIDTIEELCRLAGLLALAPFGRSRRLKATLKAGSVVGHVIASLRCRVFFL